MFVGPYFLYAPYSSFTNKCINYIHFHSLKLHTGMTGIYATKIWEAILTSLFCYGVKSFIEYHTIFFKIIFVSLKFIYSEKVTKFCNNMKKLKDFFFFRFCCPSQNTITSYGKSHDQITICGCTIVSLILKGFAPIVYSTYTVLYMFRQVLFWTGNQSNHQNFEKSLLSYKLCLVLFEKKIQNGRLKKTHFPAPPILNSFLQKFHGLVLWLV